MGNEIVVKKNRTHTFLAELTSGGSEWDISGASDINFTVKDTIDDASAIFTKTLGDGIAFETTGSDGNIVITLDNSDTNLLTLGDAIYAIDVLLSSEWYEAMMDKLTCEKTVKG